MDNEEPTYEYVKGLGWVPVVKDHRYCVIFKTPYDPWANASRKGVSFILEDAEAELAYYQEELANRIRYDNWEFKIVPDDGAY
jgi:hypothetical protein